MDDMKWYFIFLMVVAVCFTALAILGVIKL